VLYISQAVDQARTLSLHKKTKRTRKAIALFQLYNFVSCSLRFSLSGTYITPASYYISWDVMEQILVMSCKDVTENLNA